MYHVFWNTGFTYVGLHWADGWYSVSAVLTDQAGHPLIVIDQGELRVFQGVWDYNYEGTTIKVRAGLGIILLDMTWSDEEFIVRKGCFLNTRIDGYVADEMGLLTIRQGTVVGQSIGSIIANQGFGSWGMNDTSYLPEAQRPKGFGSFRSF